MFDTVEKIYRDEKHKFYTAEQKTGSQTDICETRFSPGQGLDFAMRVAALSTERLTLRKLLRPGHKLRFGDSISQFIKTEEQNGV